MPYGLAIEIIAVSVIIISPNVSDYQKILFKIRTNACPALRPLRYPCPALRRVVITEGTIQKRGGDRAGTTAV